MKKVPVDAGSLLVFKKEWRSSSVGQSARLIFVMSGVQIPPPLPTKNLSCFKEFV